MHQQYFYKVAARDLVVFIEDLAHFHLRIVKRPYAR